MFAVCTHVFPLQIQRFIAFLEFNPFATLDRISFPYYLWLQLHLYWFFKMEIQNTVFFPQV